MIQKISMAIFSMKPGPDPMGQARWLAGFRGQQLSLADPERGLPSSADSKKIKKP
jgi:hypothetical protein